MGLQPLFFGGPYGHTGCIQQAPCHLGYNLGSMTENGGDYLACLAGRFSVNGVTSAWTSFLPTFVADYHHTWRRSRARVRLCTLGCAFALGLNAPKTSVGRRCSLAIGPRVRLRCLFAHLLCLPPSGEIVG